MKQCILVFSSITLLLTCGIGHAQIANVLTPAPAVSQDQGRLTEQQQAIFDANNAVQQNVSGALWFLGGAGCGIFTFAYAVLDTPQVPTTRLLGKSPAYIVFYTTEYQSKAKNKRITSSCLGWGIFSLLYFAYLGATY